VILTLKSRGGQKPNWHWLMGLYKWKLRHRKSIKNEKYYDKHYMGSFVVLDKL
jgi:hypothetical protein